MRLGISARPQFSRHREVLEYLDEQPNRSAAAMQLMWEALQARKTHTDVLESKLAAILEAIEKLQSLD